MSSGPDIKILIATHKEYRMPEDSVYLPIHAGAEGKTDKDGAPLDFGYTKDNTGDNISDKNWCFCELTALYWAWKNLDTDYIGLVHYRRYFLSRKPRKNEDMYDCILKGEEIYPLLKRYKVILPRKRHYYIESVYSHYAHTMNCGKEEFDLAREIIAEKTPEYLSAFDALMNGSSAYLFNMMIMEKSMCDRYCEWVFGILFELVERFDTAGMNAFDKRYAGRVGERLFNVWLMRQMELGNLKKSDIRELPYTEDVNWGKKIAGFIKAKLFHKKYGSSF